MKNCIVFLILLFISSSLSFAQISITKIIDVENGDQLDMELSFAKNIDVKTWDKDQVLIEASVKLSGEGTDQGYELNVDQKGSSHQVSSSLDFTQLPSIIINPGEDGVLELPEDYGLIGYEDGEWRAVNYEITYQIKMPADLALDLCTKGDVEIKGLDAPMDIKTSKGFIDVDRKANDQLDLRMSTINGEIFTDFDIKNEPTRENSNDRYPQCKKVQIATEINGGGDDVNLSSNCGNIYLRKAR